MKTKVPLKDLHPDTRMHAELAGGVARLLSNMYWPQIAAKGKEKFEGELARPATDAELHALLFGVKHGLASLTVTAYGVSERDLVRRLRWLSTTLLVSLALIAWLALFAWNGVSPDQFRSFAIIGVPAIVGVVLAALQALKLWTEIRKNLRDLRANS